MKYLLLLILSAGACLAQEPCVSGEHPNNAPDCIPAEQYVKQQLSQPAPLKCRKYEHVEKLVCPDGQYVGCAQTQPSRDYCAPDLHTVTEREWQELMARLKKLEEKPQPQKHVTACARRPDSAVFWTNGRATLYADGIVADRDRMWFDSLPTCTEKDFAIWKKSALNSAVAP